MGHADPLHAFDEDHGGAGLGAVEHHDGSVTLLGALAGGAWVHLRDGALRGAYEDGSGPWVVLHGPEIEVFDRYARLLADTMTGRAGDPPRLWSSWYSHYEDVTEEIIHKTLAGLEGLAFDVVQIDDGWQEAIGDWEPNEDFPSGMADAASRIAATGRRAGLWLAPFILKPESRLASERPELLLRDREGAPVVAGENWGGPYWALDVTRDDTLEHLAAVFDRYRTAGFEFFKLDFIYAAALPGHHALPTSRSAAYRQACARIREVVGDDTYLLACGAPIVDSIGIFDGVRIGPDVGEEWVNGTYAAVYPAMVTAVHRLWLRAAIDTDPDVVYFRDTGLSLETKRHLRSAALVSGFKGTSDPPDQLTELQRDALSAFLEADPPVEQLSRYRWRIDDDIVDFRPVLSGAAAEPAWSEAG